MANRPLLAVVFSSLLTICSFPVALYSPNLIPGPLSSLLVWFSLVPLGLALRNASPRESFRWAYLYGWLANAGALFWIIIAMMKYGDLSLFVSTTVMVLLVTELALYPALTFWLMARLRSVAPAWLVGAAALVLLEWTRVYGPLGGFPWCTPAYALYDATWLIQVSDLIGTAGLNFLIILGNLVIVETLARHRNQLRPPRIAITLFLGLLLGSMIYGAFRYQQIDHAKQTDSPLRVALLQGNIPQDEKWDFAFEKKVLETYKRLASEALQQNPHLVVWPEAALPSSFPANTKYLGHFLPPNNSVPHVIGSPTWAFENGTRKHRNSTFIVNARGRVTARYDKQHLVPYGEYIPLSDILPMEKFVPTVAGNFLAGKGSVISKVRGEKYGILICYESVFPDLPLTMVRQGASFLVNITNDAWFDQTSGPYQHVRFGRFRAIETRRPIVRAANTGITTWFDSLGRMYQPTALFTQAIRLAEIQPADEITFYVRHPRLVLVVSAFLLLFCSFGFFRRKA